MQYGKFGREKSINLMHLILEMMENKPLFKSYPEILTIVFLTGMLFFLVRLILQMFFNVFDTTANSLNVFITIMISYVLSTVTEWSIEFYETKMVIKYPTRLTKKKRLRVVEYKDIKTIFLQEGAPKIPPQIRIQYQGENNTVKKTYFYLYPYLYKKERIEYLLNKLKSLGVNVGNNLI